MMGSEQLLQLTKLLLEVFFTLAAISFLYRDNPIYKFAEHFFVGIAAGYWIVLQFHTVFLPKLWYPLVHKGIMGEQLRPEEHRVVLLLLFFPGILGLMMFAQFSRENAWLARWPMGIVIGSFAGAAVTGFASGDLVPQIQANLLPIVQPGSWGKFLDAPLFQAKLLAFLDFLSFPILILGVFCCLIYFFFSKEHRGATGAAATIGIWFLMVSFGASYGRTVATRVSLFLERATFLLTDTTLIGGRPLQNWKITALVAAPMVGFLVAYFAVLRRGEAQGEGEGS